MSEPIAPDPFNSHEIDSPRDVRGHESVNQRILHEEFDKTAAINQAALANFDPRVPDDYVEIELTTGFPEAEAAEPRIADSRRQAMLRDLGLSFQHSETGQPGHYFEWKSEDGDVDQLRTLTRADGTQIPMFTQLGSDKDGNPVELIQLLSHQKAVALVVEYEGTRYEETLDRRLTGEFGLDAEMLDRANLSLEDKRAIVATYEKIQSEAVTRPYDVGELNLVREDLVKTMLPARKFTLSRRRSQALQARAAYEDSVAAFTQRHGLDTRSARELESGEQSLRLGALNEQLRFRKRAAKVGLVAMATLTTPIGSSLGALMGMVVHQEVHDGTGRAVMIGAIIGGMATLGAHVAEGLRLRRRVRGIRGFMQSDFRDSGSLIDQLVNERWLACEYIAEL